MLPSSRVCRGNGSHRTRDVSPVRRFSFSSSIQRRLCGLPQKKQGQGGDKKWNSNEPRPFAMRIWKARMFRMMGPSTRSPKLRVFGMATRIPPISSKIFTKVMYPVGMNAPMNIASGCCRRRWRGHNVQKHDQREGNEEEAKQASNDVSCDFHLVSRFQFSGVVQ